MNDPDTGLLLVNLGTPDSTDVSAVRRYLREFLMDPRVIDIHPVGRWLLVHCIIAPFRGPKSAAAYREVWTAQGSPLLVHGRALTAALATRFDGRARVAFACRYGNPSIRDALEEFASMGVQRLCVVPLSPQYASATAGSTAEKVAHEATAGPVVPALQILQEFPGDPGYIAALTAVARPHLDDEEIGHVVMSYHGLPVRHVQAADRSGGHCLATDDCCAALGPANARCYRAQCHHTSRLLAASLGLPDGGWTCAFQSRFGRAAWIGPSTLDLLLGLARSGTRRVAVLQPHFVADCLETLEEIGMRAREAFIEAGGEELIAVPCLNVAPQWIDALQGIIERQCAWL